MEAQNRRETNLTWSQRCERYSEKTPLQMCRGMVPPGGQHDDDDDGGVVDVSAALVSLPRWRREGHSFARAAGRYGDSGKVLVELEKKAKKPWAWAKPISAQCDVIQAGTYTACIWTGYLWFDGPDVGGFDSGCRSGESLHWTFWEEDVATHWDYKRFKQEDPYCVRLSEERYAGVLDGYVVAPSLQVTEDEVEEWEEVEKDEYELEGGQEVGGKWVGTRTRRVTKSMGLTRRGPHERYHSFLSFSYPKC